MNPLLRGTRPAPPRVGYILLFVPYFAAQAVAGYPSISYLAAWGGSLFILWLALGGHVRPLPDGRSAGQQLLRPLVLTHVVFAAYVALSSIFFFLDAGGLSLTGARGGGYDPELLERVAEAQRYYCLAHAAFAAGVLLFSNYSRRPPWRIHVRMPLRQVLLGIVAVMLPLSFATASATALPQLTMRLGTVGLVAATLGLAIAMRERDHARVLLYLALYAVSLTRALLSGWKEAVIVTVGLLAVFAYPYYRRTVLVLAPLIVLAGVVVLPGYTEVFRQLNWQRNISATEAARVAWQDVSENPEDLLRPAREFLVQRSSEMSLFVGYLQDFPGKREYAGTVLLVQSIQMLVPRQVWPEKPNVERLVMERAYQSGVVSRFSPVSAKPQFVVDGYLAAGAFGVFLASLVLGAAAALTSRLAERWFGGYVLGSGLVFTSLFPVFWRANSFEFLVSTLVWGYVTMWILFCGGWLFGWIVPAAAPARSAPRSSATQVAAPGSAVG